MVLIDAQGCIGTVNQRLCEKFGYASHEMLGRPIDKMISPGAGIDVPLPLLGYTGVRRFRPFAPRRGCPGQVRA
jgi:PAS domain-containing protein